MDPKPGALDIQALRSALAKNEGATLAVRDVADELGIVQAVLSKAMTGVEPLSSDAISAVARTSLLQARLVVVTVAFCSCQSTLEADLTQLLRAGRTT
ncbi:MAG: hypothetical protein EOO28_22905 [Comamonadaceae bacterium]|nr:MAG: hypothetical protein EOO28_22905 [Comamonadaceae bacterium]